MSNTKPSVTYSAKCMENAGYLNTILVPECDAAAIRGLQPGEKVQMSSGSSYDYANRTDDGSGLCLWQSNENSGGRSYDFDFSEVVAKLVPVEAV